MSAEIDRPAPSAPPSVKDWIDQVADQFDSAWQCEPRPDIASFLGRAEGEGRRALLGELVKIDLEYRWKSGQPRDLEAYLADFPDLAGPDGTLSNELVLYAWKLRREFGSATASTATLSGAPADLPSLPRTLGKFQLLELLGQGAFGAVYRARDAELDRIVAIKLPRAGCFGSSQEQERFLREARSAAQLTHPGIVQVHEIGREGDLPYIVSDYIKGPTLAEMLVERRPSVTKAAELVAQVADALDYAHQHGVVHRDLKPANILLSGVSDPMGPIGPISPIGLGSIPKLTDFGLARRDEGSIVLTREGQILGTPAYMSPEQAAGEPSRVDGRSDLYSLGVVLYELLTGDVPFRGTVTVLLRQVREEEPRSPRRLNDRIPRDLETICLKCLHKEPARRYASAGKLAEDLRRYLKGVPITARPVSQAERAWRLCRRNPLVSALAASLVFGFLGWYIRTEVLRVRAERAEKDTAVALDEARDNLQKANEALSQSRAAQGVLRLEAGDGLGLLDLLAARETVPDIAEAQESRALLWSGWHSTCAGRLAQILGHDQPVVAVAFSPNGRQVATGDKEGTVQLWDLVSGKRHGAPLRHAGKIKALVFRPAKGDLLAVANDGPYSVVRLWETATGRPYGRAIPLHSGSPIAFSPDGRRLTVCAPDHTVQLWNLASPMRCERSFPVRVDEGIHSLAFSPDSKLLAAGGTGRPGKEEPAVHLWDVASGRPRAEPLVHKPVSTHHEAWRINSLAFSPDSRRLATASFDHAVRMWDTTTGKLLGKPLVHKEQVYAVAFSPDGRRLASGSFDGTVKLWDADTGRPLGPPLRHPGPVQDVRFHPRERNVLATRSFGNSAWLWDVTTGQPRGLALRHQSGVSGIAFSPDGRFLATASADQTARIWDWAAGEPELQVWRHDSRVFGVAVSQDGKRAASCSDDGTLKLWDLATGKPFRPPVPFPPTRGGKPQPLVGVAFSPDGKQLATASYPPYLQIVSTGRSRPLIYDPKFGGGHAVAFSPDGSLLAAGFGNGTTILYDVASGKPHVPPWRHGGDVLAVAFRPDGKLLATGSDDGTVRLWDPATGGPVGEPLRHAAWVEALAFSPDGKRLAAASRDLIVQLWDPVAGTPQGQPFQFQAPVQALAFSPEDGRWLATASTDGSPACGTCTPGWRAAHRSAMRRSSPRSRSRRTAGPCSPARSTRPCASGGCRRGSATSTR